MTTLSANCTHLAVFWKLPHGGDVINEETKISTDAMGFQHGRRSGRTAARLGVPLSFLLGNFGDNPETLITQTEQVSGVVPWHLQRKLFPESMEVNR